MKIAIFHNYLDNIGGAEMVGLTLARELSADIYTTNIDAEKIKKMGFEELLPRIFSIGLVPLNAPFRQQIALLRFRFLNLKNKYDFYIIDGDWAMSGAVKNHPNLWYVHSPIREIWDSYEYVRNNTVPFFLRYIYDLWVIINRYLNKKYAKSVNSWVCNSQNTKGRVKKYLNKDAIVINPPIRTEEIGYAKNGDFWLSVNRLINPKRIEIQLEAFSKILKEKLIIVGSYEKSRHFIEYSDRCKRIKPKNVEIKSWVGKEELLSLYANCRGFITTSKDEDFGMNAVEAMAAGKPVIAPNDGGYKETVINNKTGILIDNIDASKLADAIENLGGQIDQNPLKFKTACQEQAAKFDTKVFVEKISKEINHLSQNP